MKNFIIFSLIQLKTNIFNASCKLHLFIICIHSVIHLSQHIFILILTLVARILFYDRDN